MLPKLYGRRELRPRIKDPLCERLAELRRTQKEIRARALAVCEKPNLTPDDRRTVEEAISLLYEIQDFAARLQRPKEKWKL